MRCLPPRLSAVLKSETADNICEIRITAERNCFVVRNGSCGDTGIFVSQKEIAQTAEALCRGSLYAAQSAMVKGYITVPGGHRIGICGRAVSENGRITHITDISALCIRISRSVHGCADKIVPYLKSGSLPHSALIVSPPGCGKTTILRDAARQLGGSFKICIIDERSEIAAANGGIPLHDVGAMTCVMDAMPKSEGISIALRTMSPQIIITDETGSAAEEEAIYRLVNCGAKIITSAHGYDERDVLRRPFLGKLIEDGIFERIFVLSNRRGIGTVEKIISDGRVVCRD